MDQVAAKPKVLCIDDTPEACRVVSRLLSGEYDVLEANDGLEGVQLAEEKQPDLILVDLHMPQLTGYEVATRIKSFMPEVPVIALTADVTRNVRERALASGCDGYISKPIDPDDFASQVSAFLSGQRETLEADEEFRESHRQALVVRLEGKVRELTQALDRNRVLNKQNVQLLEKSRRRAKLLESGARVGRGITSILDLDELLSATVDMICEEFGFYYAGVFMIEEVEGGGRWLVLRAGRGEPGAAQVAEGHKLKLGGNSLVSAAVGQRRALINRDVEGELLHYDNPHLPGTRSEMALPLIVGSDVTGVLTVQSTQKAAFGEEDAALLQIVADQLAVAVKNARLLDDLREANQELVRTKTYEAIANATGEAIHWVGNKAAPVPGSVARISEDVVRYLVAASALLARAPADLREHKYARLLAQAVEDLAALDVRTADVHAEMEAQSPERLQRMLSIASIFEDLGIIEQSAQAILNIKEDFIGPVRQQKEEVIDLPGLLLGTIKSMGIPEQVVRTLFADDLHAVRADRVQLGRVFINLIKNAMEAMEDVDGKRLFVWAHQSDEPGFVEVDVIDNGVGIPDDQIDKIWMAFYTTKGDRGGTGLGLPACAQIVGQLGGRITLESEVGLGTTFSVFLPVAD